MVISHLVNLTKNIVKQIELAAVTIAIIGSLTYIIMSFYSQDNRDLFSNPSLSANLLYSVLFFSLITDGLFLLIHIPRKQVSHTKATFDPTKLTILIACYNGQNVIEETISHALKQVPADQIIIASDGSTDKTVKIAESYGVRVLDYKENLKKAFTINRAIHEVKTPYVLFLDDDTLVGEMLIPTSLLDEGYDAVAFNMLPVKTNKLINKYQMFEYRKSMILGKSLR